MSNVRTYDFSLAAGESTQIDVVGTFFRIRKSSGSVSISGEFGEASDLIAGQGMTGVSFKRLVIRNLNASKVFGTVIVSDASFVDKSMTVSGNVGTVQGNPYEAGLDRGVMTVISGDSYLNQSAIAAVKYVSQAILIRKLYVRGVTKNIAIGPISDLEKNGITINTGGGSLLLRAPNSIAFSTKSLSLVNPGVITAGASINSQRGSFGVGGFNAVTAFVQSACWNGTESINEIDLGNNPILISSSSVGVYFFDDAGFSPGGFWHFAFAYEKV